ncbi:hypothetical protein ACS0TY_026542 [Phlomoides rotata]
MHLIGTLLSLQVSEPEFYTDYVIKTGTDTSAVTIEWAMSLVLSHQEELLKLAQEIDENVGHDHFVHSRQFEVGVLDWFAHLWKTEKNDYWGYITNCGTEGNLHGILVGREVFPDGILYASKESHYSLFKATRMYRMECEKIGTLITGEIDCADFKNKLIPHQDKPVIINVNIGTTVKGAVDDLDLVIQTLEECGYSHDSKKL